MAEKIIIDTDIGDDIDDALAIALALQSSELEIVGITTVFRNTVARARMVKRILKLAKRQDIEVAVGIGKPLFNDPVDNLFDRINTEELPGQYSNDMDDEKITCEQNAVEFIAGKLRMAKEAITLIPIGPLTNIAALLSGYPELKQKIKRIVLMGGAYNLNMTEYNILCDPEAAKIVFESGVELIGVGLDVTGKCQLTKEQVEDFRTNGSPVCSFLHTLMQRHYNYAHHYPYLHDAICIAVTCDPCLASMEKKHIGVETKGQYTRGMTFNISNTRWWEDNLDKCNVGICTSLNQEKFLDLFLKRILQKDDERINQSK